MLVNHILGQLTRVGGVEGYGCGCEEHACISCSPRDPIAMPMQNDTGKVFFKILLIKPVKRQGKWF